jgi:23S rRNA pseudouridine2604 synthase
MPRSTPRPTLKLPAKAATASADNDTRRPARKPIRGGATVPKQSLAQRAARMAPEAAPPPITKARSEPHRPAPRVKADAARAPNAAPAPAKRAERIERDKETLQRHFERPEPPLRKVYPKRGIARSTGPRALPPARDRDMDGALPQAGPNSPVAAVRTHAVAPRMPVADEVRRPLKEPPRLSKRLSAMTGCSRREADAWIENGWVSVDGVVVSTLGARVHPSTRIDIKDDASKHQTETVTILLNKPLAVDGEQAEGRSEALQLIRAENRWAEEETPFNFKATHLRGLVQVGKLDAGATGMLVFTQEGSVARRINGDDTRLEKEYMVRVEGALSPDGLKLLNHGLTLDEVKLQRAQVSWQNEKQLRFVLHESRKQQIERMCELVGLRATSIKRIRIGSVSLGKLPAGQWRYLRENERF